MKTTRRTFGASALAFAVGATSPLPTWAELRNLNQAIDEAGRQRMLSQRMAKAWLAIGQGFMPARAERILADSVALFERQLKELSDFAPTPEIGATYQSLASVWAPYKSALLDRTPNKSSAQSLINADAQVLKLAHQGTVQFEQHFGQHIGKLVNMSGRQRMLSQRTAKFYLLKAWDVATPEQMKELNVARAEFVHALDTLMAAPEATEGIKSELELARQQWIFFDNALSRVGDSSNAQQHAVEVFSSSENILQVMETVTTLYSAEKLT